LCHVYLYAHNASPACTLGLCHITITLAGPRAKALASCSRPAAQRVRCACGRSSNADGWPNADGWLHACSPSPLSLGTANVPTVRLTSTASTHASPSCGPCSSILPNAAPHTRDAPLGYTCPSAPLLTPPSTGGRRIIRASHQSITSPLVEAQPHRTCGPSSPSPPSPPPPRLPPLSALT